MKRPSGNRRPDEFRPEYDLSKLKGGVRGKYYQRALIGTNLVLIEPELAEVFPDTESVNRALPACWWTRQRLLPVPQGVSAVGGTSGSSGILERPAASRYVSLAGGAWRPEWTGASTS
jgi:hypothetical protein